MRVALDTNVLVAAFATRGLCADLLQLILAEHQLILGQTVKDELGRVLRTKLRLDADLIEEYESFLERQSVLVTGTASVAVAVRDPADAQVLADAVAGAADALVTGDRDLLSVAADAPIPILDPRGFWVSRDGRRSAASRSAVRSADGWKRARPARRPRAAE